jgi:hypothetical protein
VILVSSRTAPNLLTKLHHATAAVKRAIDLRVFQDRHVGIATYTLELSAAAKNPVIAQRKSENLHAGIPERIAHAVNEWV